MKNKTNTKINIRTDLVTYVPLKERLKEIENIMDPVDFNDIEFDIEVEFDALNFGLLTDDSKRKIIQIVHADYKQQGEQKLDTLEKIREDKLSYWNTDGITEDDMTLTVENKEENE